MARAIVSAGPSVDVLCLLAGAPAVLTELLYGLAVLQGHAVGSVTVVTTRGMVQQIAPVVTTDGAPGPALRQLVREHPATGPTGPLRLRVVETPDAGDTQANRLAGREIDRYLVEALGASPLVACLSGGRKSMTAWLTIAMTLRAREADRLVHVTVRSDLERPDFLFPGSETEASGVQLADVPFVRLSSLVRGRDARDIDALVREVTDEVLALSRGGELAVDAGKPCLVTLHGVETTLPRRAWALLVVCVEEARRGARQIVWGGGERAWQRLLELQGIARKAAPPRRRGAPPKADFEPNAVEKAHAELRAELARLAPALARAIPRGRQGPSDEKHTYRDPTALLPHLAPQKLPDRAHADRRAHAVRSKGVTT